MCDKITAAADDNQGDSNAIIMEVSDNAKTETANDSVGDPNEDIIRMQHNVEYINSEMEEMQKAMVKMYEYNNEKASVRSIGTNHHQKG
jgi:hypothetical protein